MQLSVVLSACWVICATIVAMLPMKYQFLPGVTLLICAPALILWLGFDFGWFVSALALAAFVSMFRYPLRYFWRKWSGRGEVQ
ncbi:DUF2484 family protein [Ruegeria arenilitoris]|uniref:DUF2484 family protein n=1 Tax=Ruegeria arenilitoris TaxID=1173585 RepID=UPI001479FE2D|nr:DUF2484 family protein [Ruegeria arenilitoris]